MFGHNMSGLVDDIRDLKGEAPAVLQAEEDLDREIYAGINKNRLHSGSYVSTRALDALNVNQRLRVLNNFNGRYYEREETHGQFKVVIDYEDGRLTLVSAQLSSTHTHLHIHRSE